MPTDTLTSMKVRPSAERLAAAIGTAQTTTLADLTWGGPDVVAQAVRRVERRLRGTQATSPDPASLAKAVGRLARNEELRRRDLLLCSSGLLVPVALDGEETRIVERPQLVRALRRQLKPLMNGRRIGRRIAMNLATSISHARHRPEGRAVQGATLFGRNLIDWAEAHPVPDEPFFGALTEARELFTDLNAAPFRAFVTDGDADAWAPLHALEAPQNSWVRTESVRAGLAEVLDRSDSAVEREVDRLLDLLRDHEDLLDEGLGMILRRWERTAAKAEHLRLRDTVIARWESPLVDKNHAEWQLRAGEPARAMVALWLVRNSITAFFQLAGGPGADQERLDFWLHYADHVTSLRFYLGTEGRRRLRQSHRELGALASDHRIARTLDNAPTNNAFVMTIGEYHFVEFSETGNALYIYAQGELPKAFDRPAPSASALKKRNVATAWIPHYAGWQPKVAYAVGELTGHYPTVRR